MLRETPTVLWFRQDLRLADHPALHRALAHGGAVIPLYTWSPEEEGDWPPGAAARWWLHHSLASLDEQLSTRGSRLVLRRGPVIETLRAICRETGAGRIVFHRRYEPAARAQEDAVLAAFPGREDGGPVAEPLASALLLEPGTITTKDGRPFQVFTPFWRACLARPEPAPPLPTPRVIPAPSRWPGSLALPELDLAPHGDWANGFPRYWQPGEAGARRRLAAFLDSALSGYPEGRDLPASGGSSRLSPHLHHGEISPRQAWHAVARHVAAEREAGVVAGAEAFLRQLGWRDFAHHLLFHFPHTVDRPLRPEFAAFPWARDAAGLRAWRRGRTGYPLVDAGQRELWATGWMHNRVRMVAASFLVKHLLLPWTTGARWFWDTLVDADLANNTLGWQWTAGCGADAAPYFRIFNPEAQAKRFDAGGEYVRRWVPEFAAPPRKSASAPGLPFAGGGDEPHGEARGAYPAPVVEHGVARERALAAFASIRRTKR